MTATTAAAAAAALSEIMLPRGPGLAAIPLDCLLQSVELLSLMYESSQFQERLEAAIEAAAAAAASKATTTMTTTTTTTMTSSAEIQAASILCELCEFHEAFRSIAAISERLLSGGGGSEALKAAFRILAVSPSLRCLVSIEGFQERLRASTPL